MNPLRALHRPARAAIFASLIVAALGTAGWWLIRPPAPSPWTDSEVETLRSLWIGSLETLPADASNRVADDARAAEMGHRLFFDARLSGNGKVACASCHEPERRFTDGRRKARGIGRSKRNTPSLVGVAYSPWLYWDGRKDSLWAQALSPIENPDEQGGTRMQIARLLTRDHSYRNQYEALFGPLPDLSDHHRFPEAAAPIPGTEPGRAWHAMAGEDRELVTRVFVNVGKAIEAYERRLLPGPSRFDAYVEAVLNGNERAQQALFGDREVRGLRLFIGEANCTRCHNGPLLTNNDFHNTGVLSAPGDVPDKGRIAGVRELLEDPFNCLGPYSDDPRHHCPELRFARTSGPTLLGAMRTPSLRNLDATEPYMHKGQIDDLSEVLRHYNQAPLAMIGHEEDVQLGLSRRQLGQLESFLETLAAPPATPAHWLAPPSRLERH